MQAGRSYQVLFALGLPCVTWWLHRSNQCHNHHFLIFTASPISHSSISTRGNDNDFLYGTVLCPTSKNTKILRRWTKTSPFQFSDLLKMFSLVLPNHSFHHQRCERSLLTLRCTSEQWGKHMMWWHRVICTFEWCSLLSTSERLRHSWGSSQTLWLPAAAAWSPVHRKWSWRRRGPREKKYM